MLLDPIVIQHKSHDMKGRLTLLLVALGACGWLFAASALVVTVGTGCSTTQQRHTVNTLASVAQTTDAAVKTYLDQVVAGRIATNDVPSVMARYSEFQAAFNIALIAATLNTNAPPDPSTIAAAANVKSAINVSKQR